MNPSDLLSIEYLSRAITFVIFVALIVWVYLRGAQPALVAHQEQQNRIVEEAEARKAATAQSVIDAQAALEQAKHDAERIVQQAVAQAARLVPHERGRASEQADRALEFARGEKGRERNRARRELLVQTVERAHEAARELAAAEITETTQKRLVEGVLTRLEAQRA